MSPSEPHQRAARHLGALLRAEGTADRARHERAYLKSSLRHWGVRVPVIRRLTRQVLKEIGPDLPDPRPLVEQLWGSGVHEMRMAAVEVLRARADALGLADLEWLRRLVREAGTWALVDPLAADVVGGLRERVPAVAKRLDAWARDPDFWVRRAALLAFLGPLRRGEGDFERFGDYADRMLDEKEFFIRKAIGWVLRETSKKRPALVTRWVEPRAARMSGLTLREATRRMDERTRERLLAAHRSGAPDGEPA
ncbi:MAG: DNA alkylation repair protein [Gemmatimonadota bacterium]